MTIQDFINECINIINKITPIPSENETAVRRQITEPIIDYFKNKGIEVRSLTYTETELSLESEEKVSLSNGTNMDVNIEIVFGTAIKKTGNIIPITKTRSKYEKTIADIPVKFKRVEISCDLPTYEIKNSKVIKEKGYFHREEIELLQKISKNDAAADIAKKVDITKLEDMIDSDICQSVLKAILIFHNSIPGAKVFIDKTTKKIDTKGLADYIRQNMM